MKRIAISPCVLDDFLVQGKKIENKDYEITEGLEPGSVLCGAKVDYPFGDEYAMLILFFLEPGEIAFGQFGMEEQRISVTQHLRPNPLFMLPLIQGSGLLDSISVMVNQNHKRDIVFKVPISFGKQLKLVLLDG